MRPLSGGVERTRPRSSSPRDRTRWYAFALVAVLVVVAAAPYLGAVGPATSRAALRESGAPVRAAALPLTAAARPAANATSVQVPDDWGWSQESGGVAPSPRYQPMMADDPAEGGVLLWGGTSLANSAILNDTWLFHAGVWTELCSGSSAAPHCSASPSPRVGAQLAFDPGLSAVVLFGGAKAFYDVNDTWVFLHGTWENVTASVAPPPGDDLPIAVDSSGGVLLVATLNHQYQTWEYGSTGWTELPTAGTPAIGDLRPMWYDTNARVDILLDAALGTWEFSAGRWTNLSVSPAPPDQGGLPEGGGFDSAYGYGFVYAPTGSDRSTWTFADGAWTNVTANVSNGPPTTQPLALAFDSADGVVVAEEDVGTQTSQVQTWILHDPLRLALAETGALRDVGQGQLYGITVSGGVSPYLVTVLSEPPGCGPPTNGSNQSGVFCVVNETGTFDLTVRTHDTRDLYLQTSLAVRVDPMLGAAASAGPNPVTVGLPVAFRSNYTGGSPPYRVLWTVPGQSSQTAPSFSDTFSAPGAIPVHVVVTDAANNSWNATISLSVLPSPQLTAAANRTSTDVGDPVQFRAVTGGGTPPVTVDWKFGDGTNSSSLTVNHSFATPGAFVAAVTTTDSLGAATTATVAVMVQAAPTVHPFLTSTSAAVAGSAVTVSDGLWGGTPPWQVRWQLGDGSTSNLSAPTHTFAAAGNYTLTVSVTDALGRSAAGTFVLTIGENGTESGGFGVSTGGSNGPATVAAAGILVAGVVGAAGAWVYRRSRQPAG
ncbi:MAG: PKD domain-containing protein [Thermoplasmata archaeon]|nr:PKD domain-containing protein [Thermoplasmata archaeon]